ncbi:MAG: NADP-dependent malic enzyme [Myxococcota bacterium]|nr:NADP-dependent malic enzyme [Myxococcota bacterium]
MSKIRDEALDYHSRGRKGKIEVNASKPLLTQRDLSLAYTPGVAEPCRDIHKDPELAYDYTAKGNLVAVITNGTAVLGLGNIGALAGKPVMEGKANLFKKFADIDVFDIEVDETDTEKFISAVKAIAPTFGGINLEDIRAPECFEIERRLQEECDIPVFHDDQHGTAMIASAALINAVALTDRDMGKITVVFSGAGAAAVATARLMILLGVQKNNIFMCDSKGLIAENRDDLSDAKREWAQPGDRLSLAETLVGKDAFLGLSVGGLLKGDMVKAMAPRPIVFAMANPDPEITPDEAKAAVPDAIVATGRSDYPNQVNNVLGFPFIFRGALDCRARKITEKMKVAGVQALAELARTDVPDSVLTAYGLEALEFGPDYLIPKPFDPRVLLWVAPAVAQAAADSGVARKPIADMDAYRQHLERKIERSKEVIRPLINRAQGCNARIVFPDGAHPKILRAAQLLVDERICQPVLVGQEWKVLNRAKQANVDLAGIDIVEQIEDETFDKYAKALWESRQRKGMTLSAARQELRNQTSYGMMMVQQGDADGLLGGLATPYQSTIRPALQVLGKAPDVSSISGVYVMLFKGRRFYFGDCTVNVDPDAATLAQIAQNTATVARQFGDSPRVALLSYSDFGENRGYADVDKVAQALSILRATDPDLVVDGEMQADTAVNEHRAMTDFPFSQIRGDANVLIFPNLASGNIAYKLLRELGGATAVGPVLVGLPHPVNALALGATVDDIVNMAAITVNQIISRGRNQ